MAWQTEKVMYVRQNDSLKVQEKYVLDLEQLFLALQNIFVRNKIQNRNKVLIIDEIIHQRLRDFLVNFPEALYLAIL